MDGADAPVHSPSRIQSAGHSAGLYPQPGKTEKRPLGVPTVADRALQRSTAEVLSAIYEQDSCLFIWWSAKAQRSSCLATLNEVIAGGKVGWVLEADVKNFFGV